MTDAISSLSRSGPGVKRATGGARGVSSDDFGRKVDSGGAPSIRLIDDCDDWFARLAEGEARLNRSWFKRAVDIIGAVVGLVLLSPLLLVTAVGIMVETRGTPFFLQHRTGHRGRTFVIFKFRTMVVSENGADVVQVRKGDGRVTKIGVVLRKTSIDELPQLLNVLWGDMSLVGPRPHALVHDDYYGSRIEEYNIRFRAKPGLTGLAQVSGFRGPTPDVATMAARVARDLEYIRDWSVWLDIKILFRTFLLICFHPGAD